MTTRGNTTQQSEAQTTGTEGLRPTLRGKRVLVLLPQHNFRDDEYKRPRALLDTTGARVTVASLSRAPATGMLGGVVHPDLPLADVRAADFDGVLLVGGTGSSIFWHNETAHSLLREIDRSHGTIGAICLAPVTLANAGLLEGKAATAYPSAGEFLAWRGATYTGQSVERAGNIVTASGPEAAEKFARLFALTLGCDISVSTTAPGGGRQHVPET